MALQEVTEDRIELIKGQIVHVMEARLRDSIQAINEEVYGNSDAEVEYFLSVVGSLYQKVIEAQKQEKFGKLKAICISYLRTSTLEDSLELQLRALDERGYNSECIDVPWIPTFVNKYYKQDVDYMIPALKNTVFRLTTREEYIAKFMYASDYYKIVLKYLLVFIDSFQYHELLDQVETEEGEEISLIFGELYEQGTEIYAFQKLGDEQ